MGKGEKGKMDKGWRGGKKEGEDCDGYRREERERKMEVVWK